MKTSRCFGGFLLFVTVFASAGDLEPRGRLSALGWSQRQYFAILDSMQEPGATLLKIDRVDDLRYRVEIEVQSQRRCSTYQLDEFTSNTWTVPEIRVASVMPSKCEP